MKTIKRVVLVLLLILTIGVVSPFKKIDNNLILKANSQTEDRELKAVWMSTLIGEAPYSSETQFKSHMNNAFEMFEYYGINALIFHVRTHNNAFYPSELNPRASWWSGVNFSEFDPIAWLISESHNRGIEFHAWMNPYRVTTGSDFQSGELPEANPQSDPDNLIVEGSTVILNPAKEAVREHIYDTITEFAELYPSVDAIHFDDYFYINTTASPTGDNARRANIDLLIEGVYNTLTNFNNVHGTAIQFGISPTGIYRNGNGNVTYDANGNPITTGSDTRGQQHYGNYLYADTVKWAVEGWIDYLMPQTYWARNHTSASFTTLIDWWDRVFKNLDVNLYSGIGVYMADMSGTYQWYSDMTEMDKQLALIDTKENVQGYSIYSYKHLQYGYNNSTAKSGQQIRNAYATAARRAIKVPPIIKTMTPAYTAAVSGVKNNSGNLTWTGVNGAKFYYIYRSTGSLTYSSSEIIGVVGGSTTAFTTNDYSNDYNYGVKALSKTNHLSEPSTEQEVQNYPITFNLNSGSFPSGTTIPNTYTEESNIITLPIPERNNYEFKGWYGTFNFTDSAFTSIPKGSTGDKVFYAKWEEIIKYEITYILNGGNLKTHLYNDRKEMEDDFILDFNAINDYSVTKENFHGNTYQKDGVLNIFTASDKWVWLKEYLISVAALQNHASEDTLKANDVSAFRFAIFAFLNETVYTAYPYTADYSNEPAKNGFWDLVYVEDIDHEYQEGQEYLLPTPTKDGFSFLGWYDNESFSGSPITVIASGSSGDKEFYAKWDDTTVYQITYNLNEGTFLETTTIPNAYTEESNAITLPIPVRSNYEFKGWYDNESFTGSLVTVIASGSTGDKEFYASWEEESTYQITFELNEGTFLEGTTVPTEYTANSGTITLPIPEKNNYEFKGWYTTADFTNTPVTLIVSGSTGNKTFYAKWEIPTYQITYHLDNGSFSIGAEVIYEYSAISADITLLIPLKEGYEFAGWYLDESFSGSPVTKITTGSTGNKTFYAKWEIPIYQITYHLNGGVFAGFATKDEYIKEFLTDFYTFLGLTSNINTFMHGYGNTSGFGGTWYSNNDYKSKIYFNNIKTGNNTYFLSSAEYQAKWESFTVFMEEFVSVNETQNFWGSSYTGLIRINQYFTNTKPDDRWSDEIMARIPTGLNQVILYTYEQSTETFSLPIPKKDEEEFLGWYLDASFTGTPITEITTGSTGNKTFYALWEEAEAYSISYELNGGSFNDEVILYSYTSESATITLPVPTKLGFIFDGWYLTPTFTGSPVSLIISGSTGNKAFYASWEEITKYTITYELNGGEFPINIDVPLEYYEQSGVIVLPIPVRENFVFVGWYISSHLIGDMITEISADSTGDLTFYAKWKNLVTTNLVTAVDGASIRTEGTQGLRFLANLDSSVKNNKHGFYLIYGSITVFELEHLITNNLTNYQGKNVIKVEVSGTLEETNEYSVVLIGIPIKGYLDGLTAVPYVIVDGEVILASNGVTRSVAEIAVVANSQGEPVGEIINELINNLYTFETTSNQLRIKPLNGYLSDKTKLQTAFMADWNAKFGTSLIDTSAIGFFESARSGLSGNIRDNRNILNSNIYKFFNDPIYQARWLWLLNFLESVDITIHTKGQIQAIKADGTYYNQGLSSNKDYLYHANHLSYSIYNFFNGTHEVGGYTAIDFTNESTYEGLLNYNNVFKEDSTEIDNNFMFGSYITLPALSNGYRYYDGVNYYSAGASYLVSKEATLQIVLE